MYEVYVEKAGLNIIRPTVPTYTSSSTDDTELWSYVSSHRGGQHASGSGSFSTSSFSHSSDTPVKVSYFFAHDMLSVLDDKERFFLIYYDSLSKMARDLLTPPVSTVASEFAFSTSGRICSVFRKLTASEGLG
ncbi:C-terminal dimerization domain [Abeliophyllum distichum]|uniref:C-terminal dimerization domain n=1 Tax=Abeliophyllum distichum TaxID=126358 RepID=A0ABD1TXP1_9LAMI